MGGYGYPVYVPVARRRALAARALAKRGSTASPVVIIGTKIATSFWGKAWCEAMESYGDFENRLPRGRSYVRNGSVVDLQVTPGLVSACVSGSQLYHTSVKVSPLAAARWASVVARHAGQVSSLVDLLQGKLPASLLTSLADRSSGLFPGPKELVFSCSCPDWAMMCKHVAAVLYGVGARLDHDPALFFRLRGVDVSELAVAGAAVGFDAATGADDLVDADLAGLFGIEMASVGPAVVAPRGPVAALPAGPKFVPASAAKRAAKPPRSKPAAQPKAVVIPAKPGTISAIELDILGVPSGTVAFWLTDGTLQRSGEAGVYVPQGVAKRRVRELLAERA